MALGAAFPSEAFERSNKTIALVNALGVVALLLYSVFVLGSLCLLCSGFYVFAIISAGLFWKYGIGRDERGVWRRHFNPSLKYLATFGLFLAVGAYGMREYHATKKMAMSGGGAARIVRQSFEDHGGIGPGCEILNQVQSSVELSPTAVAARVQPTSGTLPTQPGNAPGTPTKKIPPTETPVPSPTPIPIPKVKPLKMSSPEYGAQAFLWWRPETADRDLGLMRDAGMTWVKQIFAWQDIEGAS